jgi:hypothetical protein
MQREVYVCPLILGTLAIGFIKHFLSSMLNQLLPNCIYDLFIWVWVTGENNLSALRFNTYLHGIGSSFLLQKVGFLQIWKLKIYLKIKLLNIKTI